MNIENYNNKFEMNKIIEIFKEQNIDFNICNLLNHYIPKYKIILLKEEYYKYGIHRYGWVNVMFHFFKNNYYESSNFHIENPDFEWVQYAFKYNLSNYDEAVNHYKEFKPNISEINIKFIVFDDWIEKTYIWSKNKRNNMPFISFIHDPPTDIDINSFSFFMQKKISQTIFNSENFIKDKQHLKLLITLSDWHKNYLIKNNKIDRDTKINFLHHPHEMNCLNLFSFDAFMKKQEKNIFMIGWWLRNYDTFIKMKSGDDVKKKILLKNTEGNHVKDYVFFEIRKVINKNVNNSQIQYELSFDEINELDKKYNISIINYLENSEYDNIFTSNIIFLEFYSTSANNVILECISSNTPVLVNLNPGTVEYLGVDYPFYFSSIAEAEEKLNNYRLIYETHIYLSKMDKSIFTYSYFNEKLKELILQVI